jgi:hypothetical protein
MPEKYATAAYFIQIYKIAMIKSLLAHYFYPGSMQIMTSINYI